MGRRYFLLCLFLCCYSSHALELRKFAGALKHSFGRFSRNKDKEQKKLLNVDEGIHKKLADTLCFPLVLQQIILGYLENEPRGTYGNGVPFYINSQNIPRETSRGISFNSCGNYIAVSVPDQGVRILHSDTLMDERFLSTPKAHGLGYGLDRDVLSVAWSPNNKLVAVGYGPGAVFIWDLKSQHEIKRLEGFYNRGSVTNLAWSPCGKFIAAANDEVLNAWSINSWRKPWLYSFSEKRKIYSCTWHNGRVWVLLKSPNFTGNKDSNLEIWDAQSNARVHILPWPATETNIFTPEDGDEYTLPLVLLCYGRIDDILAVDWSPCKQYVATGGLDSTIKYWNVFTKQLTVLEGHEDMITSVAWSPCGQYIASGSHDKSLKIWDARSKKCLATFLENRFKILSDLERDISFIGQYGPTSITSIAWSPCGMKLVATRARFDFEFPIGFLFEILWSPYDVVIAK